MLIGAQIAGNVYNRFLDGSTSLTLDQWHDFWWIPAGFAVLVAAFFALFFHDRGVEPVRAEGARGAVPMGEPGL